MRVVPIASPCARRGTRRVRGEHARQPGRARGPGRSRRPAGPRLAWWRRTGASRFHRSNHQIASASATSAMRSIAPTVSSAAAPIRLVRRSRAHPAPRAPGTDPARDQRDRRDRVHRREVGAEPDERPQSPRGTRRDDDADARGDGGEGPRCPGESDGEADAGSADGEGGCSAADHGSGPGVPGLDQLLEAPELQYHAGLRPMVR